MAKAASVMRITTATEYVGGDTTRSLLEKSMIDFQAESNLEHRM